MDVGKATALTIGIAAEAKPLVAVDVDVPDGFTLTGSLDVPSWTATRDGDTIHYTGGRIEPFGCGYVTLRGRAERKGRLVFPFTVTAADGSTTRHTDVDQALPTAAGVLYAGVELPGAPEDGDDGNGGTIVAIAVAAAAALAIAGVTVARRRRLQARATARRAARATARRASGSSRPGKSKRQQPRRR